MTRLHLEATLISEVTVKKKNILKFQIVMFCYGQLSGILYLKRVLTFYPKSIPDRKI